MNRPSRRMIGIAWATVALYVLVAVCLTHMPRPPTQLTAHIWDKYLHGCGYFLYAALIYTAAGLTFPRLRGLALILVLLLALWAAADEITQPLFGRDCDIFDWVADMIGVLTAVVLLSGLRFVNGLFDRRRELRPAPAGTPVP